MTAQFSLSSIDSASLEWPDLPGVDAKLDVLAPTPPVPPTGTLGWRQFGACLDELGATKALTELLDSRSRSMHDRADMCLRATFTIECGPVERRPAPVVCKAVRMQRWDTGHERGHEGGDDRMSAYNRPTSEGSSTSLQSWVVNLAPLVTLALLLGAWFVWLH